MNTKEAEDFIERTDRCKSCVVLVNTDWEDKIIFPKGTEPLGGKNTDTHSIIRWRLPSGEIVIVSTKLRPPIEILPIPSWVI